MGKTRSTRSVNRPSRQSLPLKTTVGAAVCFALYGLPQPAWSDPADVSSDALQEITVTANRREQVLEAVPYSMSVISAEQLTQAGVTDLASLASTVPGLSMYDFGARLAGATAPIIRGINATAEPTRGFRTFEQNPVGTYIGNSPIDGYFQLDDLKQVEVLRGPQGTLYGAGALGGALRLIPNAPELNTFAGSLEAGGGRLDHSSGTTYSLKGMINLPLGDTLAFRASAKYVYEPGFINAYGLLKRTNNGLSGFRNSPIPPIQSRAPVSIPSAMIGIFRRHSPGAPAHYGSRMGRSARNSPSCIRTSRATGVPWSIRISRAAYRPSTR
jgi:outer membrane receptor protein involved in Fe transport